MEPLIMTKKAITDLIRTLGGSLAAILVANGTINESLVEPIIGTAVAIAVLIWTITTKDNK